MRSPQPRAVSPVVPYPDAGPDPEALLLRSREDLRRLTAVLTRLDSATRSVPELVTLAPELICELGFDRGLVSRVTDGVWYPELMFIMGDPEWSAEVTEVGKSMPQRLEPGLYETTLVRTRRAILVADAQTIRADRWIHPGLAAATETRSYVAAPILAGRDVVGILHADRYGSGRDVDELDRDLLTAFAEALRLALSRAALTETLHLAQERLAGMSGVLADALESVNRAPVVRIDREPGAEPDTLVVRTGPRTSTRPLPDTLTPREIEVLALMATGSTNLAIARALVIADGTVKQHVKHILRKLDAGNRAEAAARWFQSGGEAGVPDWTEPAPAGRH